MCARFGTVFQNLVVELAVAIVIIIMYITTVKGYYSCYYKHVKVANQH